VKSSSRGRTALAATLGVLVVVVALLLSVRVIVLDNFRQLERDAAVSDVERVGASLHSRIEELLTITGDWAPWNDSYEFVAAPTGAYVDANLAAETLSNLDINYMIFYDLERDAVHAAGVDLDAGETVEVPTATIEAIAASDELFDLPDLDSGQMGLLKTPEGIVMVAASPITDSALEKPARGTLVIGRRLDAASVAELSERTRMDVSLQGSSGPDRAGVTKSRASTVAVHEKDGDTLTGSMPLVDMAEEPIGSLDVSLGREVWHQGVRVSRLLSVFVSVFGLVLIGFAIGVTDRRILQANRAELADAVEERTAELQASEARFRGLVSSMVEGLLAFDGQGRITFANREACRILGVGPDALLGMTVPDVFGKDPMLEYLSDGVGGPSTIETTVRQPHGLEIPVEIVATGFAPGEIRQWLVRDVTVRKRYEDQLMHLARHDHLTGLANRRRFEEDVQREMARAQRVGGSGGLLWLDLDNFKEVNDSLGHRAGDELLIEFADFLLSHTRAYGVVSRIGGDEFAVLLPDVGAEEIEAAGRRLIEELALQRFPVSGHKLQLTAAVGATLYPEHGPTVEELLSRADVAMYRSKDRGAGMFTLWADSVGESSALRSRLDWSERIRRAIDTDSIVVHAQPIADSDTGAISSYELLMRLPGDTPGELIMPGDFLPVAERLGLIRDLDRWMVVHAIRHVAERGTVSSVHVNLSGHAFCDPELLDIIKREFAATGADPSCVGFEITETAAIADLGCARELIAGLRQLGCGLALDDFGAGFSSFYYLRNLPIDRLKIDGAFIQHLPSSESDRHLVKAMVELARALGVDTVAEYVENQETLDIVREMGVTFAQGYHVGRPAPLLSRL